MYTETSRGLLPALILSAGLSQLPNSMVAAVLPVIAADLGATLPQAAWLISGNLLAVAVGIALGGPAADVFGVRRSYLAGLGLLTAGTAVCAVAPDLVTLVAGRVLQGAGGGVLPALAAVSITRLLPHHHRGRGMGLVFAGVGVGGSVGPVVGGLGTELIGWRALFAGILVPLIVISAVTPRVLPPLRSPGGRHFDLLGGLLLAGTVGPALLAVTTGQALGFAAPQVLGAAGLAVLCGILLSWRVRTAPEPLFRPRLFASGRFASASAVGLVVQLVNLTAAVLVPILLVQQGNHSPAQIALVLLPAPVVTAAVAPLAGRAGDRIGRRPVILAGLLVLLAAALWLSAARTPVPLAVGILLLGTGIATVLPSLTDVATRALDNHELGTGVGIYQACSFLGAAAGPAMATAYSNGFLLAAAAAAAALAIAVILE